MMFLVIIWTAPEMAAGTLAACLPVAPKFWKSLKETKCSIRFGRSFRQLRHHLPLHRVSGLDHHVPKFGEASARRTTEGEEPGIGVGKESIDEGTQPGNWWYKQSSESSQESFPSLPPLPVLRLASIEPFVV